jgi:hypothetical protein
VPSVYTNSENAIAGHRKRNTGYMKDNCAFIAFS